MTAASVLNVNFSIRDTCPMTTSITRAEALADTLRQAIHNGDYICGERLVELTLSQQMNVSQNTVRDALHILQDEGWVVKHARRGAYVRAFTPAEAAEVYALWAAVEGLALRWMMEALSKSQVNHLRRLLMQARNHAFTGDSRRATEALLALHAAIAAGAGRPQTTALLARLRNQVHLLEVLRRMRAPRSLHAQQAHILLYEKLVSLMEAGDADGAGALLDYLIKTDGEALLPLLA
ncbi:MAG: GntR family transcriptional regulator [Chloroflexi bacterium]|nr:GntR family transcriptional regulator [Chloroflexota bacterium]